MKGVINVNVLCRAKRMSDGTEVQGYIIKYGTLFTYIIEKDYIDQILINGLNECIVELKLVRVLEGSVETM